MKILFIVTTEDVNYLIHLKPILATHKVYIKADTKFKTLLDIKAYCAEKSIYDIATTSTKVLNLLLGAKATSVDNYAGSLFKTKSFSPNKIDLEVVILNPLKHIITVNYGTFMLKRYLKKLTHKADWPQCTPFSWELITPANYLSYLSEFKNALAIAIDIETVRTDLKIKCIGYTAILQNGDTLTGVLPLDSEFNYSICRKLNWEPKCPKIFQNGKYDLAYLSRYNLLPYNYLCDTATMQHCIYSELPKSLATLSAFYIRDARYWKEEAHTSDLMEYYAYNAKDTWATAHVWIAQLISAPAYALKNYRLEFPLLAPCHMCELTGIAVDSDKLTEATAEATNIITSLSSRLDTILRVKNFNVASPLQMKQLLVILGAKNVVSADATALEKAKSISPLAELIVSLVLKIRKQRKLVSTYLEKDNLFIGKGDAAPRILYSLNPHGTDTGRTASGSHHFWTGLNIQTIPRGKLVKQIFKADPGFYIAEVDSEQAETRDTAYISGDQNLIDAVESTQDFHSINCSAFFSVPYDEIYSDEESKVLNKELRDTAKRVGHGANYDMGAVTLVSSMTEANVYKTARALGLNKLWSLTRVAQYLLDRFHATYPKISGRYYPWVITSILKTKLLVGATGWTRYCFGDPTKDRKPYVAHPPQSINAMRLNIAFVKVFNEIAMHPQHRNNFKLIAQIHDSILFQYRIGHEYLVDMVKERMEIEITVTSCDAKERSYIVPAAICNLNARYWSET